MGQSLVLDRQKVQEEVAAINELAEDVKRKSEALAQTVNRCVAAGIQTTWGIELQAHLNKFNNTQMADAINEIKFQASKLAESIETATAYSENK